MFKSEMIEFDGKGLECTIRNVSPTGATPSLMGIPHEIVVNSKRAIFASGKRSGVASHINRDRQREP